MGEEHFKQNHSYNVSFSPTHTLAVNKHRKNTLQMEEVNFKKLTKVQCKGSDVLKSQVGFSTSHGLKKEAKKYLLKGNKKIAVQHPS
jgi:hypothetical protein